jgi:hypothetical protein
MSAEDFPSECILQNNFIRVYICGSEQETFGIKKIISGIRERFFSASCRRFIYLRVLIGLSIEILLRLFFK